MVEKSAVYALADAYVEKLAALDPPGRDHDGGGRARP